MSVVFERSQWPRILQLPSFARSWDKLGLDHLALIELEIEILRDPMGYPVMKHTGGLRKARFVSSEEARGKSGAYRIGYFAYPDVGLIVLAILWGKNEKSNLSSAECKVIAKIADEIKELVGKGGI